ncbi:hypothetical protein AVEN_250302-1 [Araneus ventricosus]|uniref:Uncharacterized protein n=1 Tax=Araneus ventricosus TaxID=182803 RepID=A0A4Y2FK73_ARAVE|nr:hypothetical protein AVEN_250302-1 [Araneus ventricosus]
MSFYITVPSDSSQHFFPDNKVSNYVIQLPSPIALQGEWEFFLAEIIYPHTWHNVNNTNNLFGFDLGDEKFISRRISPGCYETVPDILREMNLNSFRDKIQFMFNSSTQKVKIKVENTAKVVFEKGLCDLLGFEPQVIEGTVKSPHFADPHAAFPFLYIYTDIESSQIVGNVQAPLLRILTVGGNDGEIINVHYDRPHYVPVIRNSFQTIEIGVRLNSGELVPFERGKYIIMSVPYVCCPKQFEEHYTHQTGSGLPYYRGIKFQKGYGLGGMFRHFFRTALPFLVKGAKAVRKEALITGSRIAQDVLAGENFKASSKQRAKEAGKALARNAINKAQTMICCVEFSYIGNLSKLIKF